MRIHISNGSRNIHVAIPTGLLFNRLTAHIGLHYVRKYASDTCDNLTPAQINAFFTELHRVKQMRGRYELVDVQTVDGQKVKIIL